MRRKPKWLALLLVLGLVLAACGDGDGGDTTTTAAAEEEATTTAAPEEEPTTTAGEEADGRDIATDVGVDLEAGTITIGLLSDLSGPFAPLVTVINTGHELYWASVNEAGGINGLNVELAVRDTAYVPDTCADVRGAQVRGRRVRAFDRVAPHHGDQPVVAGRWNPCHPSDLVFGLVRPCHQRQPRAARGPYCIEAMNMIEYLTLQDPEATTIAIATERR